MLTLDNNKIKKIVNVYQLNLVNGKTPGFGDFLRGCFFLMQLSKKIGIEFDIDISNHPISQYVINNGKSVNINYDNIEWIVGYNRPVHLFESSSSYIDINFVNQVINKANNSNGPEFGTFVTAHPIFNNFKMEGRNFIKSKLEPNKLMNDYIDITLQGLNLEKNKYGVIHVRTGDKHLIEKKQMYDTEMEVIKKLIISKMLPNRNYLLLSDSLQLRQYLKSIPNLTILIRRIEHIGGEGIKGIPNGIMNTMLEFYLMSYSRSILSLSKYNWVSGFSKWCSIINNIPLYYIKI
jgi:hypothetical protein